LIDSVRDQELAMAGVSDEIPFLSSDEDQDKTGGGAGPKAIKI
jgi:hypothetical protein